MKILCLLSDIIFIPVIQSALSKHDLQFLESYNGEASDFFVLDMDHKDSFEVCKKFPSSCLCFGSHKNTEQIQKFKDAGCVHVVPRSLLNKKLLELI